MCWVGKDIERMSDKDIETFKIMYWNEALKCYTPPFRDAFYNKNQTYSIEGNFGIKEYGAYLHIYEGIHCYSKDKCIIEPLDFYSEGTYTTVKTKNGKKELEFYPNIKTTISPSFRNMKIKCVKCIIPAGTTYYENDYGEIVTRRLIIKEEINE